MSSPDHLRFTVVDLALDSDCCQENSCDCRGEDNFLVHHVCNETTERLTAGLDIAGYFISPQSHQTTPPERQLNYNRDNFCLQNTNYLNEELSPQHEEVMGRPPPGAIIRGIHRASDNVSSHFRAHPIRMKSSVDKSSSSFSSCTQ